jgi:hypothetical protein
MYGTQINFLGSMFIPKPKERTSLKTCIKSLGEQDIGRSL